MELCWEYEKEDRPDVRVSGAFMGARKRTVSSSLSQSYAKVSSRVLRDTMRKSERIRYKCNFNSFTTTS